MLAMILQFNNLFQLLIVVNFKLIRNRYLKINPIVICLSTRSEQKNRLNWENRKKITEKTEQKKKPIKPIKILKNQPVWFRFYKQKTKKTKPKKTRKKPEPNRKNRSKTGKNWENRAKSVWSSFGFFLKISVWLFFLIKTKPNRK